jgi:hypothetical protein
MNADALARMRARAQQVRTRASIRRWHYRQRHHASGVWYRLRRVLTDARAAYVIDAADLAQLISEGHICEPCGGEIAPPKVLLFVDDERLATLVSRREIPVNLGPEFMAASAIALVRF